MARRAEGWKLVKRGRVFRVRFSFKKKRYEITTGESVAAKAEHVAAQLYTGVITGRVVIQEGGQLVHPGTLMSELCSDWIVAIAPELGRDTGDTYTVYARHWVAFFETIGRVSTSTISHYGRERLATVTRKTVSKELSALRRFLLWAFDEGMLRDLPEVRMPSKKALGVRHAKGRKAPTHLSPQQVEAILTALPERGRARGGKELLIRDYFTFCYETALRPDGTVDHLEERDFAPAGLRIRSELDKNRWERTVPLSATAAEILGRLVTGDPSRKFFGDRDRRDAWRNAAKQALGPDLGKRANPYDLKHARVTAWFSAGKDPMGIRFLTGTNEAIERYALPSRAAAERALWGDSGNPSGGIECEGRDLNSHESYLTSTSSKSGSENQRENCNEPLSGSATTGNSEALTGAPPQYADPALFDLFGADPIVVRDNRAGPADAAAFRARSASWFCHLAPWVPLAAPGAS